MKKHTYSFELSGASVVMELPAKLTAEQIWELNFKFVNLFIAKIKESRAVDFQI